MADTMQFDLVSPERSLASLQASAVSVPGAEGALTAMPGHAPLITTLRPGVVRVTTGAETTDFVVTNGFVEVTATSVSVIAEQAYARDEANKDTLAALLENARNACADCADEHKDMAELLVADLSQLLDDMV